MKGQTCSCGKILAFLVLGLLVVSAAGTFVGQSIEPQKNRREREGRGAHAPIHIDSDTSFANMAASEGWPGNGTQDAPYIIEGYEIDGNGGSYCIWIENTTVYFVVRNCYVYNATGGQVYPFGSGITLKNVRNAQIVNNTALSTSGIYLDSSSGNTVANNNFSSCMVPICLNSSSNNTITNNNATLGFFFGIYLNSSANNTIANNDASNNFFCIFLNSSANNTIANNEVSGGIGIYLYSSDWNTITNNNANGSFVGIWLNFSRNNAIANNNASNCLFGIYLDSSTQTTAATNILWGSGFCIWGDSLEHWNTHRIDTTNLVNGKPVYYYKDQNGGTVPSDAGQVILANCSHMVIEGLNISNASIAIQTGFSSNNRLLNNTLSGNLIGIFLVSSTNTAITNNNASGNFGTGIFLESSSNNTITYNWICNNTQYGINVTLESTSNIIHHNNFIGNYAGGKGISGKSQAYDDVGGNYWYDAQAREGNYWSNWDGNGWGTPSAYPIDGDKASDWYPLSKPYSEIAVAITLEKTLIDGRKDTVVNATVSVVSGTTPMSGVNVTLITTPSTNIQITPVTGVTGADGTAKFTIRLTSDFTDDTTVSIEPVATINGIDYTGAPANLTIKGVSYNITVTLEADQIDGINGSGVNATVTVMCNTVPISGVNVALTPAPGTNIQIAPATATTDANGTAKFTITLTADFTNDTTVSIEPVATINGRDYTGAPATLTVKGVSYNITVTLEADQIDGINGSGVNATVTVMCNTVPMAGMNVTLTAAPGTNIQIAPATATTDTNGTAKFTITLTSDFTNDTTVSIEPKATINGRDYTGAPANLTIKGVGAGYEVIMTLEKTEIEGSKDTTVKATITVKQGGVGVANLTVKLIFDNPDGLTTEPATATTDANGVATLTIKLTKDFSSETKVKVTPNVDGKDYSNAAQTLTIKAKGETTTPGFEFVGVIAAIALVAGISAYTRRKEH